VLASGRPLEILAALSGSVHRSGHTSIGGSPVVEFTSHTTLADLYEVTQHTFGPSAYVVANGDVLLPSAAQITILVRLWVDSADRVVQIQATEPLYEEKYAGGLDSVIGNPQVPSIDGIEGLSPLQTLERQGSLTVTVKLAGFGQPAPISAPPSSQVCEICSAPGPS
jgi:hypothetical protein